jgi:hypothetical protein
MGLPQPTSPYDYAANRTTTPSQRTSCGSPLAAVAAAAASRRPTGLHMRILRTRRRKRSRHRLSHSAGSVQGRVMRLAAPVRRIAADWPAHIAVPRCRCRQYRQRPYYYGRRSD